MPTIIKRGDRYLARARRGALNEAKTFTKRADAAAWARKVEADMEAGRWVSATAAAAAAAAALTSAQARTAAAAPTIGVALRQYRGSAVARLKGAATYAYWFDELEASPIADRPVDSITPADLAAWRDEQAQRVGDATVVRKMGLLSGFFTWCHKERGWIASNPMHSVRKPRVADARDRIMSDDERRYLLAAADTSRAAWLADALTVLLRSAMRRGELWGLKRGAVDFDRATAHLADTKNGSARDVPLCPDALGALRRLDAAARARGDDALVPVGDPHAVSLAFRRTLARAQQQYRDDCQAAGVQPDAGFLADVRLHDCRHEAISHWAGTGGLSVIELMQVSGHRSARTLLRYAHLSASKIADKLAAISAGANVAAQQQAQGAAA